MNRNVLRFDSRGSGKVVKLSDNGAASPGWSARIWSNRQRDLGGLTYIRIGGQGEGLLE